MEDCRGGGRVRHPATHVEIIRWKHTGGATSVVETPVCLEHATGDITALEGDGWVVVSFRRRKL